MYHVYAHLAGPIKFIVFVRIIYITPLCGLARGRPMRLRESHGADMQSMVHTQCPDPSTSYPPLLAAVNKIAAEANADA
jgi:hypothetical protein